MNKVVLITGASSGIGKSIAEFLHYKGYIVYGTSRNPKNVRNSVFPLLELDVRNTESIHNAVNKVIELSGAIDIVINNAGVGITGPIEEIPSLEIKKFRNQFLWTYRSNEIRFAANASSKIGFNYQYYLHCRIHGIALSRNIFCI